MKRALALSALALLSACKPKLYTPEEPHRCAGVVDPALDPERAKLPKLVLQVTVDQLGQRVLSRFLDSPDLQADTFRKLVSRGAWFGEAYYAHTSTETAVGHATLFTGALPKDHGIVGNEWFDLAQRREVMAVEDAQSALVGAEGLGRSARNLLVPTLGDVMIEASKGQAMVVAVSEKDRGALLPAGHKGRAYWLDDASGRFITSSYAGGPRPAWLDGQALSPERLRGETWSLTLDEQRYRSTDDLPWEKPYKLFTRTFPHALTPAPAALAAQAGTPAPVSTPVPTKDFVRGVKYTPFGDELVLAFVRELFAHEAIGRDEVPDLLSVSFSSTDYVGHSYGPDSREAEDNFVRLDRTLGALLALAEESVGPERLLLVLSADHGVTSSPEASAAAGLDAGRIEPRELVSQLNAGLRKSLGVDSDLILEFVNPSLWLDEAKIAKLGLSLPAVERALVDLAKLVPGMHAAFSRSDALGGALASDPLGKRVADTTHPQRSGHVYLVQKEHWMLTNGQAELCATHGSPWPADSHVPIVFYGSNVPQQGRLDVAADPRGVAPTLAKRLGIPAPSAASAGPLPVFYE